MTASTPETQANAIPPQQLALLNALKATTALPRLIVDAGNCDTAAELHFFIVNKTAAFCRYQRAVLFTLPTGKAQAVSGVSKFDKHSALTGELHALVQALKDKQTAVVLSADSFAEAALWSEYAGKNNGTSALWLPLTCRDETLAGLWLERWGELSWSPEDAKALSTLAGGYAVAYSRFRSKRISLLSRIGKRKIALAVAIVFAVVACLPVRQRVTASCEVVPAQPYAVTAGVDGVIGDILVRPGESVKHDQIVAVYEKGSAEEELKAAEQQVRITDADYQRARVDSLYNPEAKGSLQILANRLEQDKNRYAIVQNQVAKMVLTAPADGVVIMRDPYELEGKPVTVGERLLIIAHPDENKVRISLPVADRIDFPADAAVTVVLNADIQGSRRATLTYVSQISSMGELGMTEFVAEAVWSDSVDGVHIGMRGTAIIYGEQTSLFQWLGRRPIAAIRRLFGW